MKKVGFGLVWFFALIIVPSVYGQRGKIIKTGDPIMDLGQDGYVSKTTVGFSSRADNIPEFDRKMFGIPKVGGDVTGDNVGKSCGIADLIPDSHGYASYAVQLADADNNLIFRFRVGDNNSSVEAWSVLLDTDGLFGIGVDPNATAENPGFEIAITLIKNTNKGVYVFNIDGADKCPAPLLNYPLESHFQIAIADEQPCGSPTFFYDYYVPFREIANALNIDANTGLRFAAVTNASATCALEKIADVSGVNDTDYRGCYSCMFNAVVNAQSPPTPIADLCEICSGFKKVSPPTINQPLVAGQRIVGGTTVESNIFVLIQVFTNLGTATAPRWDTLSPPRMEKGVFSKRSIWNDTLPEPLLAYDKVRATAKNKVIGGGNGNGNQAATSVTTNPGPLPVAQNKNVVVNEDALVDIILGPPDPHNFILGYSIVTHPTHGTLGSVNTITHQVTYVPNFNYSGPDTFTFKLANGTTYQSTGTISITVNPVNDFPIAYPQGGIITTEDTPKNITLKATDIDAGDVLSYIIVKVPAHGTVSLTGSVATYTPAADYFGLDSFIFKANDGTVDSNPAIVFITVTPVNDPPVAHNQSISVVEDTPKGITLSATDVAGNALTYTVLSLPAHGTLSGTAPNLTYKPALNYNGSDSFTFKANDGIVDSNTGTISITVTPVNDAPVANNQSVTTDEDVPVAITLSGSDVDGNSLTYSIVAAPAHGTVSLTGTAVTYTPAANFFSNDNFTFKVNDGTVDSNIATISITVTPVNDAPVADNQNRSVVEDTPTGITLSALDPGDVLTFTILSPPAHGTLSGTAPNLTYLPALNYNGSDSFTFKANDGIVDSNTGTISITVTPVNDAPVANNQGVTTDEDVPIVITLSGSDVDGNSLTYSIVAAPAHGTVSLTGTAVTYTPAPNFFSNDRFTFKVNDGTVDSNIATISITVTPVNDAPVADNQNISVVEDTPTGITLSAVDAGDALTYSLLSSPAHGTLSGTAPNLTYIPALNYNGADSFTFKANDGTLDSNTGTISITVTPVNDAPFANSQGVTTAEDVAVAVTLGGSDADGNSLTYTLATVPTHGSLSGTIPNLTYTPTPNYNGSDNFTFTVNDGTSSANSISGAATVSITITSVNDRPIADAQSLTTPGDTQLTITLTGSDVDDNGLTYSIGTSPHHGTLSGTAPNLIYTPDFEYNGPDDFTFAVDDGTGSGNAISSVATVSITVTHVNDAPIADNQSVNFLPNTPTAITLTGSDPDGDPIIFMIVSQPLNGTLTGSAPNVTYTPNDITVTDDEFTFRVSDGSLPSNVAAVILHVPSATNDPPTADNQLATVKEDVPESIVLSASDPNADPLTYHVTPPTHGTLSGTAPNVIYTPDLNYYGSDSFTFTVDDGALTSNTGNITITVKPVNDTPIADNQSVSTAEDTFVGITLTGSDVDGDVLTSYTVTTGPAHGTLSGTAPSLIYTPGANYNGSDHFTFEVNDGKGSGNSISVEGTVSITITPVNDAPVANDDLTLSTPEDTDLVITLTGSDVDENGLTYSVVTSPVHGVLIGTAPNLTYVPDLNYNGPDGFTFTVDDGLLTSNTGNIKITVMAVNDTPIADRQALSTAEDTSFGITLTGSDVDGDVLTSYTVTSAPARGTLSGTAPNLTYTPEANYYGPDAFTFTVDDGTGSTSAEAVVFITVTPVNDRPIADIQTLSTLEDTDLGITLTGSGVDGNGLTYSVVTAPVHGALIGTAPNLTYVPALNYNGPDSLTFTVDDGTGSSNSTSAAATVSIDVKPVNDTPIADLQVLSTAEDTSLGITLTGSDVDGDVLTSYTVTSAPARGTLSGTAPNLTYTPGANYYGPDAFTFTVSDGIGSISAEAVVFITITPVNDAPFANDQTLSSPEDTDLGITLTGSGVDGNGLTYSVVTSPTHGALIGTAPNLTYVPALNYNGPDSLTFTVDDGTGSSNSTSAAATVSIDVTPVNDTPIADNQSVDPAEDTPVGITLTGSDVDGNTLTYSIIRLPAHGVISGTAPNLTYTPGTNYNGTDNFTFTVDDGTGSGNSISATATVSITISPVNDAPGAVSNTSGVTVVQDSAIPITLVGSDVDGDALTYIIVTPPSQGTLSGTVPNVIYTPALNYSGSDSFTFKVNDGVVDSNIATISITVLPLNNAPIADDQSLTTQQDVPKGITLTSSDIDGDPSTYFLVMNPDHGTLTGTPPNLTYTPELLYSGSDSFTFKANDGIVDSNIATVSITITPVNHPPVILSIPDLNMKEDTVRLVCPNVIDVDGDQISYGQPLNTKGGGTMIKASAPYDFCYTFSPALNYNGESIWDLSVCDAGGLCDAGSVKIIITPVNDPPYAVDDEVEVSSRQTTTFNVVANDYVIVPPYQEFYDIFSNDPNYSDALTMITTPLSGPFNGTVQMSADGTVSYTPKFDFGGSDSLKYKICDSGDLCATAVVFIKVGYPPFKIYEGVSPNGDNTNDYWRIDGIELYPNNLVRVFDRFDNLVFETSSYNNEKNNWQGQANHGLTHDALPEGTYFYTVDLGNGEHALGGYVELKRH